MRKFLLFLVLAGCTVGPDYRTPDICLPSEYVENPCEAEPFDLSTWWCQFDDPALEALIHQALSCNYDLQVALHKIEEVRGLYRIDRSKLYPQLQGNLIELRARRSENLSSDIIEGGQFPIEVLPEDFSGPLIQYFYQVGFDASWEIDLFGKNRRSAEAAYRDFEASQENALDVQISLISDVARTYIDIRSFQQQIVAKEEQIQRQTELLELVKSRYLAGLISYVDVARAQTELDAQISTLPPLQEVLKVATHALAFLIGKQPENFSIDQGYIPKACGRIPNDLPSDLLLRRPDIRKAERELAAATSRIGAAKAELFPTFSLLGSFGLQSNILDKLFVWPSRFWSIGPSVIWNLFTGGRLIAQLKVTNERQKQTIWNYEKAINNALRDVEDRLVGYFKTGEQLEALEEQLCSSFLTRDLIYEQYIAGLISLDEVLDAEKELFQTQQDMIESEGIMMTQLVALYKALGGGWDCSVSQ